MTRTKTGKQVGHRQSSYDNTPKTRAEIGYDRYNQIRRIKLSHQRTEGESDLFGTRGDTTKESLHCYMFPRMPNIRQYKISRAIAERIDLSSDAKIILGFLSCFHTHPRLYQAEIAGMCGLSMDKTVMALYDLEQYGLIKVKRNYYAQNRRAPSTYIRLPYAERFAKGPMVPASLRGNLDKIEEKIRDRFKF